MADLAAMLTGLESHPAAQTVPSGQPLMYASAAAQQAGSSARTQQQQRRGQQHSAALVQTSSGHAGAARATYAGAAAGAGNSGSSANTMNANAFGGNVTPAQRAAGSKVVRFERLSPAPGDSISPGAHGAGEGDIRSSGVSAAANATAPVTYIRLPSPVKVNIRVQGAN